MSCQLLVSSDPSRAVLHLTGEFDLVERLLLRRTLEEAIALGCARVEVDGSKVTFVDGGSLRELACAKALLEQRGCSLRVRTASITFRRVAALAGYAELLPGGGAVDGGLRPRQRTPRPARSAAAPAAAASSRFDTA